MDPSQLAQLVQGTDAWKFARVGSVGASDAPKVVRKTKTGYSADRDTLMVAKMLERLTGQPVNIPQTFAMQQGMEREPIARMTYSIIKNRDVQEVGIVPHPTVKGSHASCDGYVGDKGLVEIKCPLPVAHMDTLDKGSIPSDHMTQMQWQMACTGRDWCDYVSFNPDFPLKLQMFVKRVPRDPERIRELEREIAKFVAELEAKLARLSGKAAG